MNRNQVKELLPIIKAFTEGKQIQHLTDKWKDTDELDIDLTVNPEFYRIKPESKFRPFKDAEECWAEMFKHEPFGFTKFKNAKSGYYMITYIASGAVVGMNNTPFDYESMFDTYTFADGTPFGVKIKEK